MICLIIIFLVVVVLNVFKDFSINGNILFKNNNNNNIRFDTLICTHKTVYR